jgi:multidrug resistance efflux pump
MDTSATAALGDSFTNVQGKHARIPSGDGRNPQDQDNNKKRRLLILIAILAIVAAIIGGGWLIYITNLSMTALRLP